MKILAVSGWSGAGTTTLIAALIPQLMARGISVSSVKHAHHGVTLDKPGKDSFVHAQAGAREVILTTQDGFALFSRQPAPLEALLARLAPADLVLVEGFKSHRFPKLEVHRPALGKPPLWPTDPGVVAVASDVTLIGAPTPLALDDAGAIADWLRGRLGHGSDLV